MSVDTEPEIRETEMLFWKEGHHDYYGLLFAVDGEAVPAATVQFHAKSFTQLLDVLAAMRVQIGDLTDAEVAQHEEPRVSEIRHVVEAAHAAVRRRDDETLERLSQALAGLARNAGNEEER